MEEPVAAASLVRRSFSKQYCPACGVRLSRLKPSFIEGFLQYAIFAVPFVLIWLISAAVVERLGGDRLSAALLSGMVAWVVLNPWFFAISSFRCGACQGVYRHRDVICRGWGIVV